MIENKIVQAVSLRYAIFLGERKYTIPLNLIKSTNVVRVRRRVWPAWI